LSVGKLLTWLVAIAILLALARAASWGNPYESTYRGAADARTLVGYAPGGDELKVYATDNLPRDLDALMARGYLPYGELSFGAWTRSAPEKEVREMATRTGAAVIVLPYKSARRWADALPPGVLDDTASSRTSRVPSKIGFAGDSLPLRFFVNPRDFGAVYLAKIDSVFGIVVDALDDHVQKRGQSAVGLVVEVVVKDSAADRAGIHPGDVVVAVDSAPIGSLRAFQASLPGSRDRSVTLQLERDGSLIELELKSES
jgi:hypothetical protein